MQTGPPATALVSSPRTRAFTFVLLGGLLILVGTALSYTWTLAYAFAYPDFMFLNTSWSLGATVVSAFGQILEASGFLLAFYGIALVLDSPLPGRGPPSPISGDRSLVRPSGPSGLGVRPKSSMLIMEGAGLVFVGGVVGTLSQFIPLVVSSLDLFRWQIAVFFIGGVIGAAGFLLAFYGVVSTVRRIW